jgi:hypothetical protein
MMFSYEVAPGTRELIEGRRRERTPENEADFYWSEDKSIQRGRWALDENDVPQKYQDAEEQALIAIRARQKYGPDLIAKISLKITNENVLLAERLALNPLISTVTVLLQAGSFQDALSAINAQSTAELSEAAINVLLYADEIIQDAVDNYY